MRSSLLILIFAAVFVLARPIEDTADTQEIFDKAKPAPKKAVAKKPLPKKPAPSTSKKGSSTKQPGVLSQIGGQLASGAAEGITSTLTNAGIDLVSGGSEEAPVEEAPVADA
ncbi:hypothetical protein ONZ45_g4511 [Pleurotus djamor]|nr:hypothetical protein ONZ45_g4511 [Pleurotus djamor]